MLKKEEEEEQLSSFFVQRQRLAEVGPTPSLGGGTHSGSIGRERKSQALVTDHGLLLLAPLPVKSQAFVFDRRVTPPPSIGHHSSSLSSTGRNNGESFGASATSPPALEGSPTECVNKEHKRLRGMRNMGRKGRWFSAFKKVLFPSCGRGGVYGENTFVKPTHPAPITAQVVHLIISAPSPIKSPIPIKLREETAAIKIQAAFRGYLARRTMLALKRLIRLKRLVDGNAVKCQTANAVQCTQVMARVQAQIRSRRIRMAEENQALLRQLQRKHEKELEKVKIGEEWDDSPRSKEQIEANLLKKQKAAIRRERSLAYAFSNQWKSSSRSQIPMFTDFNNPQWNWSWSEHWMTVRPSENQSTKETNDQASPKNASHSAIKQTTKPCDTSPRLNRPAAQKPSQPQSPTTLRPKLTAIASGKKPVSPKDGRRTSDDNSRTKQSIARSSVRDDKRQPSLSAAASFSTSTAPTRAMSRFHSLQKDRAGGPEKGPVSPVKKNLTISLSDKNSASSAAAARRLSAPPEVSSPAKGGATSKAKITHNAGNA